MRIASMGHAVFAATMIALGVMGLVTGEFTQVWQPVGAGVPLRGELVYVSALVPLLAGFGLLWPRTAAIAARSLFVLLLAWTLLFKMRFILLAPMVEGSYQSCGENAVIVAGAWVLYAWFANERDRRWLGFTVGDGGVRAARILFGLALVAFGLSHFFYLELTAPLVPAWLGVPVFWAYFTGGTYLLAAAAVLLGPYARLAAVLATAQMGGFTILVWVPLMIAGTLNSMQWGEFVMSWTLTASGWVVANSYRRRRV